MEIVEVKKKWRTLVDDQTDIIMLDSPHIASERARFMGIEKAVPIFITEMMNPGEIRDDTDTSTKQSSSEKTTRKPRVARRPAR